MDKKQLIMADFWSVCDENDKPIGHGGKVGNEYYDYVKDDFSIVQYVNACMLPHMKSGDKRAFTHSLRNNVSKINRILTNVRCLREVYKAGKDTTIWFYVPDIYLFLFILLMPKGKRKLVVNVYEEYIGSRAKHWIFQQAVKKVDIIFVTNTKLLASIPKGVLIPDYAYKEEIYDKYLGVSKKEQVVCLGTMNEKKQLEEAVEAFSKNGYPLYIAGQFSSKDRYHELCKIKADNVKLEDRYVDFDAYYQLLAESKYCLVPYDAVFYKNRTSGVIQECLFCDTVPISHQEILEFADIQGVGYDRLKGLADLNFKEIDTQKLQVSYAKERETFYQFHAIKTKVVEAITGVS